MTREEYRTSALFLAIAAAVIATIDIAALAFWPRASIACFLVMHATICGTLAGVNLYRWRGR